MSNIEEGGEEERGIEASGKIQMPIIPWVAFLSLLSVSACSDQKRFSRGFKRDENAGKRTSFPQLCFELLRLKRRSAAGSSSRIGSGTAYARSM